MTEILIYGNKKCLLGPNRENTVYEEKRSSNSSRKNHKLIVMCALEHYRDEETMSFSSTQAFFSSRFFGNVLRYLDNTIGKQFVFKEKIRD